MKSNDLLWVLGGGALLLAIMKRQAISDLGQELLSNLGLLEQSIPSQAQPYADIITEVAEEQGLDPLIITALGQQESAWGAALSPPGPAGTGDGGHGRGIMQIDDRTWASWLGANDWTDPYTNVTQGAVIFLQNLDYFAGKGLVDPQLTQASLAAYNAGPGRVWGAIQSASPGADFASVVDSVTTNYNYSSSVVGRLNTYASNATELLGGTAQS